MTTRAQHVAAAATRHDLDRAAVSILRRGGEPEYVWQQLLAAVTGRYNLTEKTATAPACPRHPHTRPLGGAACPLCGPQET